MAHPDPILPVRALPRSEIEVSGSRVLVDARDGEIAYVPFDEDAEYLARAVNAYPVFVRLLTEARVSLVQQSNVSLVSDIGAALRAAGTDEPCWSDKAVPFDDVAVRVAPDGSIGLAFMKNGREMFFSDTRHLTPGDVLNVSGVVGSLRITSK